MNKIVEQLELGEYTVLICDALDCTNIKDTIRIENFVFEAEIAYDFPNAVGIKGHGSFLGKTILPE